MENSKLNCFLCEENYILINSENKCYSKEFIDNNKTIFYINETHSKYCSDEIEYCYECENNEKCIKCQNNFFLVNNDEKKCVEKSKIESIDEYYLNDENTTYYSCNNSLYNSEQNCKKCSKKDSCYYCQDEYTFIDGDKSACIKKEQLEGKYIIDPNIHRFLYVLVKYFFFKRTYMESSQEKLRRIVRILRTNGLNLDINCLENRKCDTASLEAILKFIQTQNFALASEIFENIIIRVLSFAFVTRNDEFFGKYLYNNLDEFKMNKQIFLEWIDTRLLESLFNETNKDLLYALDNDISLKQLEKKSQAILCKESTFLKIIYRIIKTKIFIDNSTENSSSDSTTSTVLGDYTSIYSQLSELYFGSNFGLKNNYSQLFPISFSILISAYIYHQNRKSPFMKYIDNVNQTNSDLVDLPFSFVISEGGINDIHSSIILSPIRMEPRITNIELNKNRIDIYGIFELHKVLLFNKNIKTISIQSCAVKSKSLNTFHDHYTIYNNNNVEKLYMSSNYLKSDADSNLSNLLIHLKELKYLSLIVN
jgi:hypothetical protein